MLLTVKRLLGQKCCLHVSGQERISLVKSLVCEELSIPENQQALLFQGKVLKGEHKLSDYLIGPESILYLVIKKPEQAKEPSKLITAQPDSVSPRLSQVLEKYFRTSGAVRVLERMLNDYYKGLGLLSRENIEELAGDLLSPEEGKVSSVGNPQPQCLKAGKKRQPKLSYKKD